MFGYHGTMIASNNQPPHTPFAAYQNTTYHSTQTTANHPPKPPRSGLTVTSKPAHAVHRVCCVRVCVCASVQACDDDGFHLGADKVKPQRNGACIFYAHCCLCLALAVQRRPLEAASVARLCVHVCVYVCAQPTCVCSPLLFMSASEYANLKCVSCWLGWRWLCTIYRL